MKWSFKLGRFLGIDVFVHVTFLLLLAFVGIAHWVGGQNPAAALSGVLFLLSLFLCVLLHEYGHALMARRFGIGTQDITLLPIGGVARLERLPEKPSQELKVALAGPAVNVAIALLLAAWLTVLGLWEPLGGLGPTHGSMAERLLVANVFLVLFNLLPAFPMDGGRVLRALLSMRMDQVRATSLAAAIGKGMAVVFAIFGLIGNPMLFLIAFFVWIGASGEAVAVRMKAGVSGATVSDAMETDFVAVTPGTTLDELGRTILAGPQTEYPVTENNTLVGVLYYDDIISAIHTRGHRTTVREIMCTDCGSLDQNEALDEAISRLRPEADGVAPVLSAGRIVGMLTYRNINEFLVIREARRRHGASGVM